MTVNTGGVPVTLFVGGPRHGTSTTAAEPIYLDIPSGTRYALEPAAFTTLHAVTGRPEWTYNIKIYVHESIVDMYFCHKCSGGVEANHPITPAGAGHLPNMVKQPRGQLLQQSMMDASLRHVFYTTGTKVRATGVLPPESATAAGNGAGVPAHEPVEIFLVACEECGVDHSFPTLIERAQFAATHKENNPDHTLSFDTEMIP